jgi:hypothetical protein
VILLSSILAVAAFKLSPGEFKRDLMTHALDQSLGFGIMFVEVGAIAATEHGPGGVVLGVHLGKFGWGRITVVVEARVVVGWAGDDVVVDVGHYLGG